MLKVFLALPAPNMQERNENALCRLHFLIPGPKPYGCSWNGMGLDGEQRGSGAADTGSGSRCGRKWLNPHRIPFAGAPREGTWAG